jgi:hypothetical protein
MLVSTLKTQLAATEADDTEVADIIRRAAGSRDIDLWLDIFANNDDDNILSWTLLTRNRAVAAWLPTRHNVSHSVHYLRHITFSLSTHSSGCIEFINLICPLNYSTCFSWGEIRKAIVNDYWEPLVWLYSNSRCQIKLAQFRQDLWREIIGADKFARAEQMGIEVTWNSITFRALCETLSDEKTAWALSHPSFTQFVEQKEYDILYRTIAHARSRILRKNAVVLARHLDAGSVLIEKAIRGALNSKTSHLLRFVLDGLGNREVCLSSGGALLHALRHKKHAMSVLKRNFRLTRSDFASVGLSGAFFDDM